jgi:hypothetical protein
VKRSETAVLSDVLLAGTSEHSRLWRNNSGALYDQYGRLVRFGVAAPGGSDAIGFRSVTITQDMVGQTVALFAAIEVKAESGRVRPEQRAFIDMVTAFGGIAGVARSAEQARVILCLNSVFSRSVPACRPPLLR